MKYRHATKADLVPGTMVIFAPPLDAACGCGNSVCHMDRSDWEERVHMTDTGIIVKRGKCDSYPDDESVYIVWIATPRRTGWHGERWWYQLFVLDNDGNL